MRVLVASPHPTAQEFLSDFLRQRSHDVSIATDGHEAWDMLQNPHFARLAILSQDTPDLDGLELCRRVRKSDRGNEMYLIVLTSQAGSESVAAALLAGADACVHTSAKLTELEGHLSTACRFAALMDELVDLRDAGSRQGTYDLLTNLDNRATILATLRKEVARCRRAEAHVAVIMVDLDRFGTINETYGRRAGDAILSEVARRLGEAVRIYDQVGRYGDEEFLVVAPNCDPANAAELAGRLRTALTDQPYRVAGRTVPLTVSIGVSSIIPGDQTDESTLLDAAETAMVRAQKLGYDRVEQHVCPDAA